ncbi:MAG: VOC family protein [Chloroflexota bacterium]
MSRPVHFEITADDTDRCQRFYSSVFGWKFNKWAGPMDYWLIETGPESQPGINGGMSARNPQFPSVTHVLGVASVDELTAKITASGGKIIHPKMAVPGVGWLVYFADTEGNISGMMQNDPSAR